MGKFWDKIKDSFTQTANEQKAKYEPGGKYSNTPESTSTSTPSTPAGGSQANPSSSPTAGYMNGGSGGGSQTSNTSPTISGVKNQIEQNKQNGGTGHNANEYVNQNGNTVSGQGTYSPQTSTPQTNNTNSNSNSSDTVTTDETGKEILKIEKPYGENGPTYVTYKDGTSTSKSPNWKPTTSSREEYETNKHAQEEERRRQEEQKRKWYEEERRRQEEEQRRRQWEEERRQEEERRRWEEEQHRQFLEAERRRQEEEAMKNNDTSRFQIGNKTEGGKPSSSLPNIPSGEIPKGGEVKPGGEVGSSSATTPSDTNKPQWQIEAEKEAAKRQEDQNKKLEEEKKKQEAAQNAGGIIGGNAGNAATESDKEHSIESSGNKETGNLGDKEENLGIPADKVDKDNNGDSPMIDEANKGINTPPLEDKEENLGKPVDKVDKDNGGDLLDKSKAEAEANMIDKIEDIGNGWEIVYFKDGHTVKRKKGEALEHQEPKEKESEPEDTSGGGATPTTTPDTTTPSTGGTSDLDGSKINLNKATSDLLNEFLSVMKDPSRILDFANKYGWVMGQNAAANTATAAQMAGMNKAQAAMMGQNAAAQNSMQGFGKGADMRAGLAGSAGNMASGLINAQLNRDMFNQQQAYNKQQTGLNIFGNIARVALPIILGAFFGSSDSRLKTITKVDGKPVKRSKYFDQAVGKIDKYITANKPKDYKSLIWRKK